MERKVDRKTYTLNWVVGHDGKGTIVLTNSSLPVIPSKGTVFPCHDSHKPVLCSAKMIMHHNHFRGTCHVVKFTLISCSFDGEIEIQVNFDLSFLDLFIDETTEVLFPLPIEKPVVCNMTISNDVVILTHSSLHVVKTNVMTRELPMGEIKYKLPKNIPIDRWLKRLYLPMKSKTPNFVETEDGSVYRCSLPGDCLISIPCHDGHVPVKCSAKLAWSQTLGSETSMILLLSSEWLETPIYVQIDTDR